MFHEIRRFLPIAGGIFFNLNAVFKKFGNYLDNSFHV